MLCAGMTCSAFSVYCFAAIPAEDFAFKQERCFFAYLSYSVTLCHSLNLLEYIVRNNLSINIRVKLPVNFVFPDVLRIMQNNVNRIR